MTSIDRAAKLTRDISASLKAEADSEYSTRIDAERITWEFASPSTRHLDAGRESINESPLFGGKMQMELFS